MPPAKAVLVSYEMASTCQLGSPWWLWSVEGEEKQNTPTERFILGSEIRELGLKVPRLCWHPGLEFLGTDPIALFLLLWLQYIMSWGWLTRQWVPIHWAHGMFHLVQQRQKPEQKDNSACFLVTGESRIKLLWITRSWLEFISYFTCLCVCLFVFLDLCGLNQVCVSKSCSIILWVFIRRILVLCPK